MKLIAMLLVLVLLVGCGSAAVVNGDDDYTSTEYITETTTGETATTTPVFPREAFVTYLHETLVPRHGLDQIHSVFFHDEHMLVVYGHFPSSIAIYSVDGNDVVYAETLSFGSIRGEKYGPDLVAIHVFAFEHNEQHGIGIEYRAKYTYWGSIDHHLFINDERITITHDTTTDNMHLWHEYNSLITQYLPGAYITTLLEATDFHTITDHTNWQQLLTEDFYYISLRFPLEFGWTIEHGRACWQTGEGMTAAVGTPISIGVSFRDTGAPRRLTRWALEPAANFSNRTEGEIHWIDFIMPDHDVTVVMYIELL
ncbi:MAG: hypothetical protein FWD06_00865 [Oscillospiraceae bacterium]|nr:hypothetical protein [Oscillospiraceae bacterium]